MLSYHSYSFFCFKCLGYICCVECAVLSALQKCGISLYKPVKEDPSLNLQERAASPTVCYYPVMDKVSASINNKSTVHNYKPMVNRPPKQLPVVPSTSKHEPAIEYTDDVQPCSSKSINSHRAA